MQADSDSFSVTFSFPQDAECISERNNLVPLIFMDNTTTIL